MTSGLSNTRPRNATAPTAGERLARLVNQPGGATLAEAVQAADAKLERIRDDALGEIGTMLDRMHVAGAALPPQPSPADLAPLYALSNTVIGVAGVFGLGHLGGVAYSLCELLDRLQRAPCFSRPAVQVHLDSLRLLKDVDASDTAQIAAVQAALRRVVANFPKAAQPSQLS